VIEAANTKKDELRKLAKETALKMKKE